MTDVRLDIDEVLKEEDTFRLVIRGHATVEQAMEDALTAAFNGRLPGEIRSLPFRTRLALLVALEVVFDDHAKAIAAFARLRNELAHGKIHDVTAARARGVLSNVPGEWSEPLKSLFEADPPPPTDVLVLAALAYVPQVAFLDEQRPEGLRLSHDPGTPSRIFTLA
jgi:hypothetical protein